MELNKQELKKLLFALSEIPTVSGMEGDAGDKLCELVGEYFDFYRKETCGGHIFGISCGKENAPKLLIDAHFDEIGFMVTKVMEDGFLSVARVGGIDTRILPAARMNVYGTRTVPAYFASTPPHLQDRSKAGAAPDVASLMLDTSLGNETKDVVRVGTLCGFASRPCELMFDAVSGHGFDNKASCASAIAALAATDREKLQYDVYLHLAAREEVGCVGTRTGGFDIAPDIAIVLDAEFAAFPGVREDKTVKRGKGPSLTASPVCDKRLTARMHSIARETDIPVQKIAYGGRTGTDADPLNVTGQGIPCVLMGIPLSGMHTAEEIVDLNDLVNAARLIKEFAERGE